MQVLLVKKDTKAREEFLKSRYERYIN